MKTKLKKMIAVILTASFLLSGCTTISGGSQEPSANGSDKPASGIIEESKTIEEEGNSEESTEASEIVPTEPLTLETPAGAVLVGKIRKDSEGWYFEPEDPLTVKLTCYLDRTLSYENLM